MQLPVADNELAGQFEAELKGNILPFWMNHTLDRKNQGFFGAVTNKQQSRNQVERSAVLCGRILWTFSTAARLYSDPSYLQVADWAFDYLSTRFWDQQYQGVYWSLDLNGTPVNSRKHTYAQSFSIYGLSAYYQASQNPKSLALAQDLFTLIETHTHDPIHGGNIECRARDWSNLADMRLSTKEINSSKSMNTLLHLMESYASLAKIWPDVQLMGRLESLVRIFLNQVIDPVTGHQRLFFTDDWKSISEHISYGHDIETSWLLAETAEGLCIPELINQIHAIGIQMAQVVMNQALGSDGSILYEADLKGPLVLTRQWWAHAEAVVGFYNAYQLSGEPRFEAASLQVWNYIQNHFVDRQNGDWFKVLREDGTPILTHHKVGPWECPYHHARMCFEMMQRIKEGLK
jgi:mannobiose 2-epimerase